MGRGMLARQARPRGNRRQDFAPHPQSPHRPQGAASGVGLRDQQPAGARSGGGIREIQRDHRHSGPHRTARSRGCPGLDRRHGLPNHIAQSTLDAGADYLLAVKDNQPTLHAEIESYFATAPAAEVEKVETIDKDHGRFEVRNYSVSHQVDWYAAERSYPGAPRFPQLTTIAMVESRIERGDKIESERRSYISSRALSAAAFAAAARGHWAIENKLHWVLDVTFREDLSRLRTGHGAKNMAVVRHFALNLVRQVADKRSIKRRRKRAAWDPQYLLEILGPLRPKPC